MMESIPANITTPEVEVIMLKPNHNSVFICLAAFSIAGIIFITFLVMLKLLRDYLQDRAERRADRPSIQPIQTISDNQDSTSPGSFIFIPGLRYYRALSLEPGKFSSDLTINWLSGTYFFCLLL